MIVGKIIIKSQTRKLYLLETVRLSHKNVEWLASTAHCCLCRYFRTPALIFKDNRLWFCRSAANFAKDVKTFPDAFGLKNCRTRALINLAKLIFQPIPPDAPTRFCPKNRQKIVETKLTGEILAIDGDFTASGVSRQAVIAREVREQYQEEFVCILSHFSCISRANQFCEFGNHGKIERLQRMLAAEHLGGVPLNSQHNFCVADRWKIEQHQFERGKRRVLLVSSR